MADYKFPPTLAACADRLYELRERRLAGQRAVDAVEAEERALRAHLIEQLPRSDASGVAGKLCRVSVVTKQIPQVTDWEALYAHIKRTNGFDLLNRALNKRAVEERYAAGKTVAGVETFAALSLSINKL